MELRDKLLYLKANKGQTVALDTTQDRYLPNNPAISLPTVISNSFAAGVKVVAVVYSEVRTATATLYTPIVGSTITAPARAAADFITAADQNALYTDVVALAAVDKGSPTTPWHHNHSNHTNHGNHSSHFSHSSTSDSRLKQNIQKLQNALELISNLIPVTYEWKGIEDRPHIGFIAQDIETILPEWSGSLCY